MKEQKLSQWGIWQTEREWEDAEWFATAKLSQAKLDELLATKRVSRTTTHTILQSLTKLLRYQYRDAPPAFGTTRSLFHTIDEHLKGFGGPKWHHASIRLPEAHRDSSTLYYRCPRQSGDVLFGTARFAGEMAVAPELIYKLDDETRVYKELFNGDEWDRIQVSTTTVMTKIINLNLLFRGTSHQV